MGRKSKFDPAFIQVTVNLCERGFTDVEIAKALGIAERTLYEWRHEYPDFAAALVRSKRVVNDQVRKSLLARANGFERRVQKATASGKVVEVVEYFPPDVNAQRLWLQNRDDDFAEKPKELRLTADDAFLRFLEHVEATGRQERVQEALEPPRVIDITPNASVTTDDPGEPE